MGDFTKRLIITPHLSTGGLPQYLVWYVDRLLQEKEEVWVVEWSNIGPVYRVQKDRLRELLGDRLMVWEQGLGEGEKVYRVRNLLSNIAPDVVHIAEFPEGFMGKGVEEVYQEGRKWKVVETTHDSKFEKERKVSRPDRVEVVSKWHLERLQGIAEEVELVEYKLPTKERPDRAESLQELGLDPEWKHVLNVGLFAPGKNQAELWEVARRLENDRVMVHFVGNQAQNFQSYWEPLMASVPGNVRVWGERSDVDRFYGSMDLLVFPSLTELMPLVPLEALSWDMGVVMRKSERYGEKFEGEDVEWYEGGVEELTSLVKRKLGVGRVPRVKVVHMLTIPDDQREKASVESLSKLSEYGVEYIQHVNELCKEYPTELPCLQVHKEKKPGYYGAYSSFRRAVEEEFTEDVDVFVVCECDCVLVKPIEEFVGLVNRLPEQEVDMFSFGRSEFTNRLGSIEEFGFTTPQFYGAQCVAFPKKSRTLLLEKLKSIPWDVTDLWLLECFKGKSLGIVNEVYAEQYPGDSLIERHRLRECILFGAYADEECKVELLKESIVRAKETGLDVALVSHYPIPGDVCEMVDFAFFDRHNVLSPPGEDVYFWYKNSQIELSAPFGRGKIGYQVVAILNAWKLAFGALKDKYEVVHYAESDQRFNWEEYLSIAREGILNKDGVMFNNWNDAEKIWWGSNLFSMRSEFFYNILPSFYTWEDYVGSVEELSRQGFKVENMFEIWIKGLLESKKGRIKILPQTVYETLVPDSNITDRGAIANCFRFYIFNKSPNEWLLVIINCSKDSRLAMSDVGFYKDGEVLLEQKLAIQCACTYICKKFEGELKVVVNGKVAAVRQMGKDYEVDAGSFKLLGDKAKEVEKVEETRLLEDSINVSFLEGAKVEIIGNSGKEYEVSFIDKSEGKSVYVGNITPNHWSMPNRRRYCDWLVEIRQGGDVVKKVELELKGKRVLVELGSKALGDTLAWFPYVEEFRKKYECEVWVSTFWNQLFEKTYSEIKFIKPGGVVSGCYAKYYIGCIDDDGFGNVHKVDWRLVPLQKVASDILGLEYREIKPRLSVTELSNIHHKKYVSIGEFGTLKAKHWLREGGWQELVGLINRSGLDVMSVSLEKSKLSGVRRCNGRPIEETIRNIYYSECFVGVGSGLSWLAWALGKKVVLVSGFSEKFCEMSTGVERIINEDVCHGCFNDVEYTYDRGDWEWCPRNGDFVCSKAITPEMVMKGVSRGLSNSRELDSLYEERLKTLGSDIYQHMPRLRELSSEVEMVTEFGVSEGFSTVALAKGRPSKLVSYDIRPAPKKVVEVINKAGIEFEFRQANVLEVEIEPTDFLFLDSLHTFNQVKQELEMHSGKVSTYIGFHDTESFGIKGEDGGLGIVPAIEDFLSTHLEWELVEKRKECNGFWLIKRKQ